MTQQFSGMGIAQGQGLVPGGCPAIPRQQRLGGCLSRKETVVLSIGGASLGCPVLHLSASCRESHQVLSAWTLESGNPD